jgi:multimeric flavodoxin WrbA
MNRVLVVYHSMTGGTSAMAHAAAAGAAASSCEITVLNAATTVSADVLDADGFVFASPENLAAMAGMMKDFFDRTYYDCLDCLNGRPFVTLICAGSDGQSAARQIERIAQGWRLRAIAPPLIVCTQAQTPERIRAPKEIGAADLERCRELGQTLAVGLEIGIF